MTNTPKPQANTLDEIEDLVTNYNSTVDRWLRKGRTIGEAYAEASREAGVKIQAHITGAKIDELDKVQELMKDNVTTIQGIIKYRLKQLKEEL